jgi:Peptidase A4 family
MVRVPGVAPQYQKVKSENWAGYAVTGTTFTQANGSWIQTKITCNAKLNGDQLSTFWVGIDGFSSDTVEQTGTLGQCLQGQKTPTYYAWYEYYPAQAIEVISGFTVYVGHNFAATIKASSDTSFLVTLTDVTTGKSYSAKNPSITEEPSGSGGFFYLGKFAKMGRGMDHTGISGGCTANGKSFGGYGSNAYAITSVNENTGAVMALPSKLSSDGTSFTMTWKSAGP